ncbi:Acid Phosphatase [Candidatus Tiddalikarchaeum anstoanum]|nr:Acid Phosphatase [Candidatus Tiddalikarchaeum anstoanum]
MVKIVIWDLDNTLWNGSVYYDDRDKITLKKGAASVLKELTKRDIKNVICSRNNEDDAVKLLEKFDILKFFSAKRIGWGVKSLYVKELLNEFKVSPIEALFVDDDIFQREEVSQTTGVKSVFFNNIIDLLPYLNVENDRVEIIKQQEDRVCAEKEYNGDFFDFLKSCNLVMTVRRAKPEDLERVAQLIARTNELNATNSRMSLDTLRKTNDLILVAELTDKFGDYGIIGESVIEERNNEWLIKDFTISCRTMGRGVGKTLLIYLMNLAKKRNIKRITGFLIETKENWRMRPLYVKRGFKKTEIRDNKEYYSFDFKSRIPDYPPWILLQEK